MATGFSSSILDASDNFYDHTCSPCEQDGRNSEAVFYCTNCSEQFCDSCVKLHNKVLRNHNLLGKREVKKWGVAKKQLPMETCKKHEHKELEMFCKDHDEICCVICVNVNHRACKDVKHLPDAAKGIFKNPEFKRLSVDLEKAQKELLKLKIAKQKNMKLLQDSCRAINDTIKQLRQELNQLLDKMEKQTTEEMDRIYANFVGELQNDVDSCTDMHEELQKSLDDFQAKCKKTESSAFLGFKKCRSMMDQAETLMGDMKASEQCYKLSFDKECQIKSNLSKFTLFGKFSTSKVRQNLFTVRDRRSYNVRLREDKETCKISGCCQLPNGNAVLADFETMRIKQLNKKFTVISSYSTKPLRPTDICHISDYEIATCTGDGVQKRAVYFINGRNGKLQLTRQFAFDHPCTAIEYWDNQLYISTGTAIHVYTMTGQYVRKLYEDLSDEYAVYTIAHTCDGRKIHVVNASNNPQLKALDTLDSSGNPLFSLNNLGVNGAIGMCLAGNGRLLICGGRTHNIIQIDREGRQLLGTVFSSDDDDFYPLSMIFNEESLELVVGCHTDNIVVFKLN